MGSKSDFKKIIYNNDVWFDQSRRAGAVLGHIIDTEFAPQTDTESARNLVSVEEELRSRPIIDSDTGRTKSRVLFVTTDQSVLEVHSLPRRHYLDMAGLFDEVHVFVLINRKGSDSFERSAENLWFYQVHDRSLKHLPKTALRAAEDALVFNGTVRPDLVVGVDPFEAGWAAYNIARDFERPLQIHVKTDFFRSDFVKNNKNDGKWQQKKAQQLLKRVGSVRTETEKLKQEVAKRYKKVLDLKTLPHFYNFSGLQNSQPSTDVHKVYSDFVFVITCFCQLTADSPLQDVFTAFAKILKNRRIGILIIGDGPAKDLYEEKAKLLGIEKSVVFLPKPTDLVSILKTSDVLVEVRVGEDSEGRVLQSAAAGLPMIAYETDLRKDLFKDGESAFLCPLGDFGCLNQNMIKFINSKGLRLQFSRNSASMAKNRLHEDPLSYYRVYRNTIESILIPENESEKNQNPEKSPLNNSANNQPK